jgi:hypothetical protein
VPSGDRCGTVVLSRWWWVRSRTLAREIRALRSVRYRFDSNACLLCKEIELGATHLPQSDSTLASVDDAYSVAVLQRSSGFQPPDAALAGHSKVG